MYCGINNHCIKLQKELGYNVLYKLQYNYEQFVWKFSSVSTVIVQIHSSVFCEFYVLFCKTECSSVDYSFILQYILLLYVL